MADQTLQVRIEGDLKNLQSALTQAKKNLKEFGTDAGIAGERVEQSFDGATNSAVRLANAEQKLSANTQRLTRSVGAANGVSQEFSRIIQDAPFGIIGIGNNIQQLTANFAQLRTSSTSTGAALKTALSSIISPANLLVLGISAVTAAFTAYQMGAFGSKKANDELKTSQDSLNDSLKETDKLARAAFYQQILKDIGLLRNEVDETGKALGLVPTNLPFEEQLKRIADRIKTATKPELEALAQFLKEGYQGSIRLATNATGDLEKQIAESRADQYSGQLKLVNEQLKFYKDDTDKAKDSTKEFNSELDEAIWLTELRNKTLKEYAERMPKILESMAGSPIKDIAMPAISGMPTKDEPILTADIIASNDFYTGLARAQSAFESFGGDFQGAVENFALNLNDLVRNNIGSAFVDFGQSIGEALANGTSVIDAMGKSLLESMSRFMSDFGQQLIAVGVAGLAFSTLLETIKKGGPAAIPASIAAIGAGIALSVAAGALRGIAGGGLGGSSSGGGGSSSMGASAMAYSGAGINSGYNAMSDVEFRIRGNDLVGVINQQEKKNNRG